MQNTSIVAMYSWLNCSGGEKFHVQGRTEVLQPGDISLTDAGVVHANQPIVHGAPDLRSLRLEEPFWHDLAYHLELPSFQPPRLTTRNVKDHRLWQDVAAWHAVLIGGEDTLFLEQGMLMVFSRLLQSVAPSLSQNGLPCRNPRLQRILDYLHACFTEKITLAALAGIDQCSQMHLLRLFKGGLGISPPIAI
ncbi:MAG: hypothetical protein AB7U29_07485 [Desulfobulbus sp.]